MSAKNGQLDSKIDIKSNTETSTASLLQLQGTFHFCNGDEYTGPFVVLKDNQKIVRQGKGIYRTFDGQTYDGMWENDVINGSCTITFIDKTIFTGDLSEMLIEGEGRYKFVENIQIEGEFARNKLVAKPYLMDPNNNIWKGTIEKDGAFVTFRQMNHFWQSVVHMSSFLSEEEDREKDGEVLY